MQTIPTKLEAYDPNNPDHNDPTKYKIHAGTVLGHIYECLKVSPYTDPIINLAVLFHDFGKATTRGRKDNGFSNYHGHEGAGVPIVDRIFRTLKFAELSPQDKKHILFAVEKHMLIHSLDKLNIKTLTALINDPAWEIVKAVGYCDEASRGPAHFNAEEFNAKIARAEEKVQRIGGTRDETRLKLKQYFDGAKLMTWFPVLQKDKTHFRAITDALNEYVLETLNAGEDPDEQRMKEIAGLILSGTFQEAYSQMLKNLLR